MNDVTKVGGRGLAKISDKMLHRGEGVHANTNITTKNNYV